MVKSVLGVNHRGLRDWLLQRVTAIILAIYSVFLIAFFLTHSKVDFNTWHILFSHQWMKVSTILFVVALLFHAWIGMWTVFTDYVKITWLSLTLQVLVVVGLLACFFWALQILWGI